jgi:hypothetical protein
MDAFDAHLEQAWGLTEAAARQRFVVDTDQKASWAMRQRQRLLAQHAERARDLAQQIAALQAFKATLEAQQADDLAYFDGLLAQYLAALDAAGKLPYRQKSWRLPEGRIGRRHQEARWAPTDAAALLRWALDHDLVRVTTETDWAAICRRLAMIETTDGGVEAVYLPTGEVVPGVTLEHPPHEVFTVRIARTTTEADDDV